MSARGRKGRLVAAGLLIALFGAWRIPAEEALDAQLRARGLRPPPMEAGLRDELGQGGFVAALGGFRSLVASFLSLEAYTAWENVDWGKLESTYDLITALQPGVPEYWEEYGWHLAYNAHSYYRLDEGSRLALRDHLAATYLEKGKAALREGIRRNPEAVGLYVRLGEVLRLKEEDHCAAAEVFAAGAMVEDVPDYLRRFAAYELAACPGREREAYETLAALFREGPQQRKPSLLSKLASLEDRLAIAPAERLTGRGRE